MGKHNPYRNESRRRKKRNGKSNKHQHQKMDKNKLPQRQAPHLRRTQSLPRPHLERQEKMARIHSKKSSGYTPPPYHVVLPHCTSHLHKNHRFLHARTYLPGSHQQVPKILQRKNGRQTPTDSNHHQQLPSKRFYEQIQKRQIQSM
jgi:hypothetical protein